MACPWESHQGDSALFLCEGAWELHGASLDDVLNQSVWFREPLAVVNKKPYCCAMYITLTAGIRGLSSELKITGIF